MFSKTAVVAFAALAGSVSAAPIEISSNVADPSTIDVAAPAGWASGYLEDYETFRVRYIAVGCDYHVGQPAGSSKAEYYETCCHPILANQTLAEVRPAYCLPSDSVSAEIESIVATATWVKEAAVTVSLPSRVSRRRAQDFDVLKRVASRRSSSVPLPRSLLVLPTSPRPLVRT